MMVVGHNPTAHELALGLGLSPQDRKPSSVPDSDVFARRLQLRRRPLARGRPGAATLVALFTPPTERRTARARSGDRAQHRGVALAAAAAERDRSSPPPRRPSS